MTTDILEMLLPCEGCGHGVTLHDGAGCGFRPCGCRHTKEDCLEIQIGIEMREHRASFPSVPKY